MSDNELIAEFEFGSENWTISNGVRLMSINLGENKGSFEGNFNYDKDWNRIMAVVDKLNASWTLHCNRHGLEPECIHDDLSMLRISLVRVDLRNVHFYAVKMIKFLKQSKP